MRGKGPSGEVTSADEAAEERETDCAQHAGCRVSLLLFLMVGVRSYTSVMNNTSLLSFVGCLCLAACSSQPGPEPSVDSGSPVEPEPNLQPSSHTLSLTQPETTPMVPPKLATITLAAGCFWCIEAVLEQLEGVQDVTSGYIGGETPHPTYRQICTGQTGHAEAVEVRYDPAVIGTEELLEWFWRLHDPTTLNRQGADVGTQYRSAIFFHDPEQEQAARSSLAHAQASLTQPIVTEIVPAGTFYPAEADHQDYYRGNREKGYCRVVIQPKLKKLGLED